MKVFVSTLNNSELYDHYHSVSGVYSSLESLLESLNDEYIAIKGFHFRDDKYPSYHLWDKDTGEDLNLYVTIEEFYLDEAQKY